MTDRLFSALAPRVLASVPGCPQPVAVDYIRNAAIVVCERTAAWRYQQAAVTMVAGTYQYAFVPPSGAEVHVVLSAAVNGVRAIPLTLEQLIDQYPKWPDIPTAERSVPRFVAQVDGDNFFVAPIPDATTSYSVRMMLALKPLRTATGMDEVFLAELEDVIILGAVSKLLLLPEQRWSDRQMAAFVSREFSSAITERRARANLGTARASLSVQPRPLA